MILVWAFLVWLRPFCVAIAAFSTGETQIWPGDLRVVAVVWSLFVNFFFTDLPRFLKPKWFILFALYFTASLTSGPSLRARSAATEEKKIL